MHEIAQHFEEYVLGLATPEVQAQVSAHLTDCLPCRDEVRSLERAMMAFSTQPSSVDRVAKRLDASLGGAERFAHLVDDAADLFDLPPHEVRRLFALLDDPAAWVEGPAPGVQLIPVTSGPAVAQAFSALVKVDAGASFPRHEHFGEERVLVLEGGYTSSGELTEFWRGEVDVRSAGSEHSFTALPGMPCLCAAVTWPPNE